MGSPEVTCVRKNLISAASYSRVLVLKAGSVHLKSVLTDAGALMTQVAADGAEADFDSYVKQP